MKFEELLKKKGEFGRVIGIDYPLVRIENLPNVRVEDKLVFENDSFGQVYQIQDDQVIGLVFDNMPLRLDSKVVSLGSGLSVPVSDKLVGRLIDPLGRDFYTKEYLQAENSLPVNREPLGIDKRAKIRKQFKTGVLLVDLVVPLGAGQRELVLGGRKTGKTSLLKMVASAQKDNSTVIIYALVGKKKSDIEDVKHFFEKEGLFKKSVIVASLASDSSALVVITPFTAFALAEHFRDKGVDTLVVVDDLSNQAKFYREISLLAKKLPGRESYPGDIFFMQARLLERAGNFRVGKREVSITCLPVAESLGNDVTGFVPTNLMSITDGHLFLDPKLYAQGVRPAINPYLSVTRVGKQTQTRLKRELTLTLLSLLTQYGQANKLAHLSSELSEQTQKLLRLGETLETLFQQYTNVIYSEEEELVLVGLALLTFYKEAAIDIAKAKRKMAKVKNLAEFEQLKEKISDFDTLSEFLDFLESYYKLFV
ncbi:MAG: hypothetical protein GXP43_03160 [bacterium]|nr:hypothetical protein [bacterium]